MPLEQEPAEGSFAPYDPASVRPSPLDLPPESTNQGSVESLDVSDVKTKGVTFDEQYREPFVGLLHLGALSHTFTWMGHEFVIRTLTTDEILAVGLITKEYEGTIAFNKAYTTAMVAMCVTSVDGEHLPYPYKEEPGDAFARARFNYVKANWYSYTIDHIYNKYLALEDVVRAVFEAMGNLPG
jgi:hypothetical protein